MIATYKNGGCYAVKEVLVNGEPIEHCFEADTVKGEALVYKMENGKLVIENDSFVPVTITGKVELVLNPGFAFSPLENMFVPI